jgi:DNA (cytosine-5)-methyltransferase 1
VAWALQERDKKGADSSTKAGHPIPVGGGFSPLGIGCDVYNGSITGDVAATMGTTGSGINGAGPTLLTGPAVAFQTRIARNGRGQPKDVVDTLTSSEGGTHADSKPRIAYSGGVRRLTPEECESLQGFPRGFTAITYRNKPAADGPRYSALGNSMGCNVMRWLGTRIQMVEDLGVTKQGTP